MFGQRLSDLCELRPGMDGFHPVQPGHGVREGLIVLIEPTALDELVQLVKIQRAGEVEEVAELLFVAHVCLS